MPHCQKLTHLYTKFTCAGMALFMVLLITIRVYMANIFWKSGLTKIDNWETTVFLFEEEYKVPFLPPEIAAYMGTAAELICPVLLVLGLGSRFAALALIIMTAVIEFTYLSHAQHSMWAMLLAVIALYGAGKLSLDYLIKRKCTSISCK